MTEKGTSRGVFNCRPSRSATGRGARTSRAGAFFLLSAQDGESAGVARSTAKVEFSVIDVVLIRLLINESEINNDLRTDVVALVSLMI